MAVFGWVVLLLVYLFFSIASGIMLFASSLFGGPDGRATWAWVGLVIGGAYGLHWLAPFTVVVQ